VNPAGPESVPKICPQVSACRPTAGSRRAPVRTILFFISLALGGCSRVHPDEAAGAIVLYTAAFPVLLGIERRRAALAAARNGRRRVRGRRLRETARSLHALALVVLGARGADRIRDRARSAGTGAEPLVYAIAGLVIFAGLTLFDFQRLRQAAAAAVGLAAFVLAASSRARVVASPGVCDPLTSRRLGSAVFLHATAARTRVKRTD
jgi:hypothetical protein